MKHAFSLVELSIVLVILGLLTGGILAGQSLIRAAGLRSITSDFSRHQAAIQTFRDKYFALPGDMTNATKFWGPAGGTGVGSACFTVESSDKSTCDGNGDGYIGIPAGGTGVWTWGERFHVWKQLANADLLEGSYTGRTDSTTSSFVVAGGKNLPLAKFSNGVYDVYSQDIDTGPSHTWWFPSRNIRVPTWTLRPIDGSTPYTPEEAWNIDSKLDDGKPASGLAQSTKKSHPTTPNCTTSDDPATADYALSSNTKLCQVQLEMR